MGTSTSSFGSRGHRKWRPDSSRALAAVCRSSSARHGISGTSTAIVPATPVPSTATRRTVPRAGTGRPRSDDPTTPGTRGSGDRATPHVVSRPPSRGRSLRLDAAQIGPEAMGGAAVMWSPLANRSAGSPHPQRTGVTGAPRAPASSARSPQPSRGTGASSPLRRVGPTLSERAAR